MSGQATQDTATKADAKAQPERAYIVYEVIDPEKFKESDGLLLLGLAYVGSFSAANEKDARWRAIDAREDFKKRATPQDGKEAEGVRLVAIAARYVGEPVLTREELDVRTVRR